MIHSGTPGTYSHTGASHAFHPDEKQSGLDIVSLWSVLMRQFTGMSLPPGTNPAASFYHLTMGYDAAYYGYLWAEVYSHDMFSLFSSDGESDGKNDAGEKCFDPDLGARYRRCILEPGATRGGGEMLRRFLGREPIPDAFLRAIGCGEPM